MEPCFVETDLSEVRIRYRIPVHRKMKYYGISDFRPRRHFVNQRVSVFHSKRFADYALALLQNTQVLYAASVSSLVFISPSVSEESLDCCWSPGSGLSFFSFSVRNWFRSSPSSLLIGFPGITIGRFCPADKRAIWGLLPAR